MTRDQLVKRISGALADGKDSGGYDTLLDMYAHIALKEITEEFAKVAEAEAEGFLSPQYASNQPFGSICERFACEEVAKAIRAFTFPPAERTPIESAGGSQ